MSKIEKLHKGDMPELLAFLNYCFTGDPNSRHFEDGLPKMWFDDEEHMEKHYVIKEDGKLVSNVGIYPFKVTIAGREFKFATVGNMGTAPESRGKGYLNELYLNANRVLNEMGVDVARLGGKRSRYERYGYEPCGFKYKFRMTPGNAKEYLKNRDLPELELRPVSADDKTALDAIRRLYMRNGIAADRGDDKDLYLTLIYSKNTPYCAYLEGEPVGYFTLGDGWICEAAAETPELLANMLCRYEAEQEGWLSFHLPPDRPADLRIMASFCEGMAPDVSSHYKIINWAGITDAMLALKEQTVAPLTDGELILGIEGYYNIHISVNNGKGSCVKTEAPADITLSTKDASRFLFGILPPFAAAALPTEKAGFISANFPLPFYTHYHDKS